MKQTCQRICQSIENEAQPLSLSQIIEPFWPQRLRFNVKFSIEANHINKYYFLIYKMSLFGVDSWLEI